MTKYNARRTTRDGHEMDSLAEARRYDELRLLEMAGEITGLEVHPVFVLQPGFRRDGKAVKAIQYTADFGYTDTVTGRRVIEDVKGYAVPVFKLKQRMFWYCYPELELRIVKA